MVKRGEPYSKRHSFQIEENRIFRLDYDLENQKSVIYQQSDLNQEMKLSNQFTKNRLLT
jgi:hypothetical protein